MDNGRDRMLSDISCSTFDGVIDPFPRASITQMCNICGHLSLYSEYAGGACTNCNAGAMIASKGTRGRAHPVFNNYKEPNLAVPTAQREHKQHKKQNNAPQSTNNGTIQKHKSDHRQNINAPPINIKTNKQTPKTAVKCNTNHVQRKMHKLETKNHNNNDSKTNKSKQHKSSTNSKHVASAKSTKGRNNKAQTCRDNNLQNTIASILGKGKKHNNIHKTTYNYNAKRNIDKHQSTKRHTTNATKNNSNLSRKQQKLNALGPRKHTTYRQKGKNIEYVQQKQPAKSGKSPVKQNTKRNNNQKKDYKKKLATKLGKVPTKHSSRAQHKGIKNKNNTLIKQHTMQNVSNRRPKRRHHKTASSPLTAKPYIMHVEERKSDDRIKKYEKKLDEIGRPTSAKGFNQRQKDRNPFGLPPLAERVGKQTNARTLNRANTTKHIAIGKPVLPLAKPQYYRQQTEKSGYRTIASHKTTDSEIGNVYQVHNSTKRSHKSRPRHKKSQSCVNSPFKLRI